jgi:hypothetical protein
MCEREQRCAGYLCMMFGLLMVVIPPIVITHCEHTETCDLQSFSILASSPCPFTNEFKNNRTCFTLEAHYILANEPGLHGIRKTYTHWYEAQPPLTIRCFVTSCMPSKRYLMDTQPNPVNDSIPFFVLGSLSFLLGMFMCLYWSRVAICLGLDQYLPNNVVSPRHRNQHQDSELHPLNP